MRQMALSVTLIAAAFVPSMASAQSPDHYLLIAAGRTETLQKEINDAAERGFRVVVASRTENTEEVFVMERTSETYRYRLLATRIRF